MTENTQLQEQETIIPSFSYFKAPISNIKPYKEITLLQGYEVIKGHYYRKRTAELRSLTDPKEIRNFKALNLDYATFAGVFTRRSDACLIHPSGLMVFDFDHVDQVYNIREFKQTLLENTLFDTQLLFFSPSGTGVKWVVGIDLQSSSNLVWFEGIAAYVRKKYGMEVDRSGKDVSRACFLCHDPEVYINPRYL